MKILHRGSVPEEKVYTGTCKNCQTKVEFTHSEARHESDMYDGNSFHMVECPVCEKIIYND